MPSCDRRDLVVLDGFTPAFRVFRDITEAQQANVLKARFSVSRLADPPM